MSKPQPRESLPGAPDGEGLELPPANRLAAITTHGMRNGDQDAIARAARRTGLTTEEALRFINAWTEEIEAL